MTAKTIWLTQGTLLGTAVVTEKIHFSGHGSHADKHPADASYSAGWDDGMRDKEFDWEDDQFNRIYGLEDSRFHVYDFLQGNYHHHKPLQLLNHQVFN